MTTGPDSRPVLVLLHGLGGNAHVWHDLVPVARAQECWADVVAVDLPGHAGGARLPAYDYAAQADVLAPGLRGLGSSLVLLGHSLGGVVAVDLAGPRHELPVRRVVAVGVKVAWTDDELTKAAAIGAKPPAVFETREQAVERYLKVAGLWNLVPSDHPTVEAGVAVRTDGGWETTVVPATTAAGDPRMAELVSAAAAPVLMVRGEFDPMCTEAALRSLEDATGMARHVTLPGLGHTPHVESPTVVADLLRDQS